MWLNFIELIKRIISLRTRNWLRLIFRRYPFQLRSNWPDLAIVDLKRNDLVFDVGANTGRFIECVLAYQPWAVIHAFEPIPSVFKEINRKFFPYSGIFIHNMALGSKKDRLILKISRFNQLSSFLEPGEILSNNVSAAKYSVEKLTSVSVDTLSRYMLERKIPIPYVKLLKIDVQGYEMEVLKGAESVLNRIEYIYLEAQFQELYKGGPLFSDLFVFLNKHDFKLLRMTEFRSNEDGQLYECDMIFKNRFRKE